MSTTTLEPEQRVLSTLNVDGSRNWLRPRVSTGRFLAARRWVAYVLIAIFTLTPYIYVNGKPLILLDVAAREFTFFGFTFLPTDTLLLALFMLGVFISIFLITALLGRAWCGWACPQTVYMEFVYRPIERLLDGPPGRRLRPRIQNPALRNIIKYAIFLLISLYLAHTFLAYFVGVEALAQWMRRSPLEHPGSFMVMAVTTALMMFDFAYFREQTCIVACPYGRFQSVLLDRHSLIISYDERRGEPRGRRINRSALTADAVALPVTSARGDCVDCGLCVTTCPTGIDIRKGLQLECVACAQCIDACDEVMRKINRPTGLIRYSSQAVMEGATKRLLRARVLVYPAVLLAVMVAFFVVLLTKQSADVTVLRGLGNPFTVLDDGWVANPVRVKIVNRNDKARTYTVELLGGTGGRIEANAETLVVGAGESLTAGLRVMVPQSAYHFGRCDIELKINDDADFSETKSYRLLGPTHAPAGARKEP